jgi:hypothetical protein
MGIKLQVVMGDNMQSGELIVSGHDKVIISLHDFPSRVSVAFGDDPIIIPCSPKHADMLEWEVVKHHCKCRKNKKHSCIELIIKWEVNGVRTVQWDVSY